MKYLKYLKKNTLNPGILRLNLFWPETGYTTKDSLCYLKEELFLTVILDFRKYSFLRIFDGQSLLENRVHKAESTLTKHSRQ